MTNNNLSIEAYRVGYQDFYGRNFKVTPAVLVPRAETEQLIDEAILLAGKAYLPGMEPPKRALTENPLILDIGTGSGNIAITLKLEIPEAEIIGLDVSEKALKIAHENAKLLNAKVNFIHSNLLENYHENEPDLIVANLPYVDKNWSWLDKEALNVEPEIALYAENEGLALIKKLLMEIKTRNWHPKILLEMDPCQQKTLIDFAEDLGFKHQKTHGFIVSLKA